MSPLDPNAAYRALQARDARFDGRLFVGVTSTGVYCRPVCRVRTPRQANCRFFRSAAQAEAAAFRPCLKCRPEIAPGLSMMDSSASLADDAAQWIAQTVQGGQPAEPAMLAALAARLGVTERHLRRIFQAAHGVSPQDYLTTQRLLLAKQLLTDTDLPVTRVALSSGFASLRRFNAAFAARYRMSPSRLRRDGAGSAGETPLRLAYRPPLDHAALRSFYAQRAVPGVEQVEDTPDGGWLLRRTLALPQGGQTLSGWVECRFTPERHEVTRHEVHVHAAPALAPALGSVLQQVRHAFDLDADPAQVDAALAPLAARGLAARPGLRLPGCFDGFELALRVIVGQQVTVRAAHTLLQRLVQRFGEPVATPFAGLQRLFPSAACMAQADPAEIGRLGIVRQRVRAIQALAAEVAAGRLRLQRGAPLTPTLQALLALPGVGPWSAQLIAMRALAWPDAFPASDIGLLNALGTRDVAEATRLAEAWRPWRAYAVIRLWLSLENLA